MRRIDWNNVQETQDFEYPTPGGYIGRIVNVADIEAKEYLEIEWDFSEGKFMGANADTQRRKGFWPYTIRRSYKDSALGFFKAFKNHLEESNPGYFFDELNIPAMRGKYIGIILGEEEYRANDGKVKTRLSVVNTRSVQAIRDGDFKIPEVKKLAPPKNNATSYGGYPAPSDGYAGGEPRNFAPAGFTDLSADDSKAPF